MKTRCWALIVLLTASVVSAQTNLTSLLQRGLFEEEANRNLQAAIAAYQSLVTQFDQDREIAATAVFRLGECYRMEGKTNEAAVQYQRILSEFSDQKTLATLSRQNLAGLGIAATAQRVNEASAPRDEEQPAIQRIEQLLQNSPDLINSATAPNLIHSANGGGTLLCQAATAGWLRVAAFLLDHGADANPKAGQTPLECATQTGNRTMVEFLLNHGADVNARTGPRGTALGTAVENGFYAVTEVLLNHRADVNARDQTHGGSTPLDYAVLSGNVELMKLLIKHGADMNAKSDDGSTPVVYAVQEGHLEAVQTLLAARADPNIADDKGRTPLSYAAERGSSEMVKMLLAAKADPNGGTLDAPLLCAVHQNDTASAELLLEAGAEPNAKGAMTWGSNVLGAYGRPVGRGEETPIGSAVHAGQLPMVQLLLKFNADPNDTQPGGQSLLFSALSETNILEALLAAGAKVDSVSPHNQETPVEVATDNNNAPAVEVLLSHGANPNVRYSNGSTMLSKAAAAGYGTVVKSLLAHGASVNAVDQRGDTALFQACDAGANTNIIELLLRKGADVNAKNNFGNTPLHVAAMGDYGRIVELLLADKADPNVRNGADQTPLDIAKQQTSQPRPFLAIPPRYPFGGFYSGPNPSFQPAAPTLPPTARVSPQEIEALLRQHGALDTLPYWNRIQVCRPSANFTATIFQKGTNDWNHFTLAEVIGSEYGLISDAHSGGPWPVIIGRINTAERQDALHFPDFSKVVIHRPSPDDTNWTSIPVNAADLLSSGRDLPLRWGDVVEIPEADHPVTEQWPGLAGPDMAALCRLVARTFTIGINGTNTPFQLAPSLTEHPIGTVPEGREAQELPVGFARLTRVSFMLRSVLDESKLIRFSSDLTRVRVTRTDAKTGKKREWILDCSNPNNAPELWLCDGDVIEVPEK